MTARVGRQAAPALVLLHAALGRLTLEDPQPLGPEPTIYHTADFDEYTRAHGKSYEPGSAEYDERSRLYEQRVAEVNRQNSKPGRLWTAAVNKLADQTDKELAALRSYRPQKREGARPSGVQFLSKSSRTADVSALPADFTWAHLNAMHDIQDQSECGSCWAFAAASVLRAHSQLYQRDRTFSVEHMVSCTPNPRQCGGDGGCRGATAELALEYVMNNGCVSAQEWPYIGREQRCPRNKVGGKAAWNLLGNFKRTGGGASFGMTGYRKLPENRVEPMLLALYEEGPVAVSVDAGANWNQYSTGIMDACAPQAVIDHAVTLIGYGQDGGAKYWHVQNSWGPAWGESGKIRLLRHDNKEENEYCGWDTKPEVGSGCKGGPSKVWVCGSCGILYDAVIPNFHLSREGLLATNYGRAPDAPARGTVLLQERAKNMENSTR